MYSTELRSRVKSSKLRSLLSEVRQIRKYEGGNICASAMKKITVALEDQVYIALIDYVAEKSKRDKSRLSVSDSARELISKALKESKTLTGKET